MFEVDRTLSALDRQEQGNEREMYAILPTPSKLMRRTSEVLAVRRNDTARSIFWCRCRCAGRQHTKATDCSAYLLYIVGVVIAVTLCCVDT